VNLKLLADCINQNWLILVSSKESRRSFCTLHKILYYASGVPSTAARSRQPWASSAKKSRPLEKKLDRKSATPQIIRKSAVKNFGYKFLGQFLPIIVKIRPQLGNLELGRFLGC
jgi:hypothetical protein